MFRVLGIRQYLLLRRAASDAKDGPDGDICFCSGTGWPGVTTAVAT
jgi:hypothetical protein